MDWPALIKRLQSRGVQIAKTLRVSRMTVWRWVNGEKIPNGNNAARLLKIDQWMQ